MRMMPFLAPVLLVASGCSTVEITTDYDPSVNFSILKTYDWAPEGLVAAPQENAGDPRIQNPLLHSRIRNAVERALSEKGYRKAPEGKPDFLVGYHVGLKEKIKVWSGGSSWTRTYHGSFGGAETRVESYEEGTLLLDFFDAGTNQLIWRGSAQTELRTVSTPEEREELINNVVTRILERFPPGRN